MTRHAHFALDQVRTSLAIIRETLDKSEKDAAVPLNLTDLRTAVVEIDGVLLKVMDEIEVAAPSEERKDFDFVGHAVRTMEEALIPGSHTRAGQEPDSAGHSLVTDQQLKELGVVELAYQFVKQEEGADRVHLTGYVNGKPMLSAYGFSREEATRNFVTKITQ